MDKHKENIQLFCKEQSVLVGSTIVSCLITYYTGTITLGLILLISLVAVVSVKSKSTSGNSSTFTETKKTTTPDQVINKGKIGAKLTSSVSNVISTPPQSPVKVLPPIPSPNKPTPPPVPSRSTPSTPISKANVTSTENAVNSLPSTPISQPILRPSKSAPTSPAASSSSPDSNKTIKKKGFPTFRGMIDAVKNITTSDSQKRKNIADEILQTERVYVGKLKVIVEVYLAPLKAALDTSHPPLTSDQIQTIFGEIVTIYNYNSHFLTRLEERMKQQASSIVFGDIFISIIDFLKTYSVYINNYTKSLKTLENVRKSSTIDQLFLQYGTNPACDSLDLNSLLIMPVQRIPRYILLLTEIIKNTDKESQDYANLNKALSKMKDLATEMNENRREAELLNSMYDIQLRLDGFKEKYGDFLLPHRRIILDNEFSEKTIKVQGNTTSGNSQRRYILCNDILLRTKPSGKKIQVKEVIDVDNIIFKDDTTLTFLTSSVSPDILSLQSDDDNSEQIENKWRETIQNQQKVNKENKTSFSVKRESLHV
ncbi:pleckstrin (PH) domain-containing protein [Tieghemostelium lacteum]|uniref:Pleckstrin (PH) domain-containing protein n=1 Tax=Tieghemostelium lacteum TaxID=361077 RepID=A0A151ZE02_TIELA|nr:pleckstrin (PH) domain-containing protein [Tieghemostelium lacteum]|eukprot:KYQ92149.1 pleckstrin (PH) domain-containing protein [Tieghemostelium lacteum]